MLLARYAPIGSPRYEKLSKNSVKFEKMINWLPAQLFGIWTIFVAGISAGKSQIDRYYFWDWSDWLVGLIAVIIITILTKILSNKKDGFPYNDGSISAKTALYNILYSLLLLYIGYILWGGYNGMFRVTFYLLPYIAIYSIYTITLDEKEHIISANSKKYIKSLFSILLFFIAIIIGFIYDDPVLTTASLVTLPFIIVLLFGTHVRHLQRAKFYPIFIFAMFVLSREAWFLVPLLLLFFILRSYYYLRHQKVYPTFGVSDDRDR